MIKYLTGATGHYLENGTAREYDIGLLIQPGNNYHSRAQLYSLWAADNGAFSKKGGFDPVAFRKMLDQQCFWRCRDTLLFVAAPDVLRVLEDGTSVLSADPAGVFRR